MKPSTILTSALAALAVGSPAITKREASHQSRNLLDNILIKRDPPHTPIEVVEDLHQCLSGHDTFHTDYSKAKDGVFSITNVDHTCCEKAKALWNQVPDDRYGKAVFTEPCDGATVTEVSKAHMGMLRSFFDSI